MLNLLYGPTLTSIHDYWKNHSFNYIDFCWQSNGNSNTNNGSSNMVIVVAEIIVLVLIQFFPISLLCYMIYICVCVCFLTQSSQQTWVSESHSVVSDSLRPHGLWPARLLVHGILQARIMEWVDIPFSRGSSQPRDQTQVSCIADGFLTIWATREAPQQT